MTIPASIQSDLGAIRILVLDFDGVMTDNSVITRQDGQESVVCSRSDGLGIGMVRDAGVEVVVISMEENPVVKARCDKLKIECTHGHKHKLPVLAALLERKGIHPRHAMYVGNDVNDIPCLGHVGLGVAVADAHEAVFRHARVVTKKPGGRGAVREVVDWLLDARGVDPYGART